ncbi:hypothetical protein [Burkholderia lata]|uniref:Uncharacterized protein n=1 Tax=Burkholderia lata (strain ATCC 17760 / DSM 23089 / LMG 22485 / NCIMB 9086 / R18194 / 383) TaxID=482957 RepID=Q39AN2_BURL3|nr:hypothetical protein [Burkholderia lata]ABB10479.1 hypothetical protein Bcep18194_B0363 [Burkholderia lata]
MTRERCVPAVEIDDPAAGGAPVEAVPGRPRDASFLRLDQEREVYQVSHAANEAIGRLMRALEDDSDDCWAMYEEIGRAVVTRLLRRDRDALRAIAGAWISSDDAQAALVDTDRGSPDFDTAKRRAEHADSAMRDVLRNTLFGAE